MYLQISEVRLGWDVTGWDVNRVDYRRDFVSRSRKRAGYEIAEGAVEMHTNGLQRSGLAFSKHGPMSCTIYNKTREIEQSSKAWFEDLWRLRGWSEADGGSGG